MTGFQEPNYTQLPNDVFLLMGRMKEAELRVVLAICRMTFGFHRTRCRASLSKLQRMTGLSRQGVINGTKDAEKRGLITKISSKRVNEWVVNLVDQALVKQVYRNGQQGRPPSVKQKNKQYNNNRNKELHLISCLVCGVTITENEDCFNCARMSVEELAELENI